MGTRNNSDLPDVEGDTIAVTEPTEKIMAPRLFRVLLHNDDYTTMEFVVMVLMKIFRHSESKAMEIMLSVHQKGIGIAGTYAHDIAETKSAQVVEMAKEYDFPLRSSIEPID